MAIKDLIPWSSGNRDVSGQRSNEIHPFLALHRDINRMFEGLVVTESVLLKSNARETLFRKPS